MLPGRQDRVRSVARIALPVHPENIVRRRTSARSFFILQKDSQNLNGLERLLSRIRQL